MCPAVDEHKLLRIRADYAFALKGTSGEINNPAKVGDSALHVLFSPLY